MNEKYMKEALKCAYKAFKNEELPVGCVIVNNNKIIARAHNTKEKDKKCISHAEINAIKKASKKINDWRLDGCILYTTLEPCVMCMGAIAESRIKSIIYATENKKAANINKLICELYNIQMIPYILKNDSLLLLNSFFDKIRK